MPNCRGAQAQGCTVLAGRTGTEWLRSFSSDLLTLTDQRNRHIVAPKLHSIHLCVVAELIYDKANTDMKNRTILIIALVAVVIFSTSAPVSGRDGPDRPKYPHENGAPIN